VLTRVSELSARESQIYERLHLKIGRNASLQYLNVRRFQRKFSSWSIAAIVVLLVVALFHNPWGLVLVAAPFVVSNYFLVRRFGARRRYFKAASAATGRHVSAFHAVPFTKGAYEEWCRKEGVHPYCAKDSEPDASMS